MKSFRPILRGAVLAGGKSSRFGSDKALAQFGGRPLLHKLLKILEEVVADPVVIVNSPERYADLPYKRFIDVVPNCGPLGGVYTALVGFPDTAVLVLTCDMPLVTVEMLQALIRAWQREDTAVISEKDGGLEPFPGIYGTALMKRLESFICERRLSVRRFLEEIDGVRKMVVRDFSDSFINMNTLEDFAALVR